MSNYPPGFGSAWDLDNVEGPVSEVELLEPCPTCGETSLVRTRWHAGNVAVSCWTEGCKYQRDEDPE